MKYYKLEDLIGRSKSTNFKGVNCKSTDSSLVVNSKDGKQIELTKCKDGVSIFVRSGEKSRFDIGRIIDLQKQKDNFMFFYESSFDDSKIRIIQFS